MGMVDRRSSRQRTQAKQGGFSLIELLVAFTILLVSMVGIMPLFMRSIMNNGAGNTYTQLSHNGRSQVEELFQLDFNDARFAIPAGQTEATIIEYWSEASHDWLPGPVPAGDYPWVRETTVRQYGISAVDTTTGTIDFSQSNALDGGLSGEFVQLKEIIVEVTSQREAPLGPQRTLVLRTLKAK